MDALEKEAWRVRAVECQPGDATRVLNACLADLEKARTVPEIRACARTFQPRFREVPIDETRPPLRIGLLVVLYARYYMSAAVPVRALTGRTSPQTWISTSGCASRFLYQPGCSGEPPREATMT